MEQFIRMLRHISDKRRDIGGFKVSLICEAQAFSREGRFRGEVLMRRELSAKAALQRATLASFRGNEIHQLRAALATDMKTRAEHYRHLADMLSDNRVVNIVRDCACELEKEASSIEARERQRITLLE